MNRVIFDQDFSEILEDGLPFERLAGKTVLITGANGFLPAYLVETLLAWNQARGATDRVHVVGLVRSCDRAERRFSRYLARPDFELLVQDAVAPVRREGPVHFIVHAASQASPKYYGRDPVGTLLPNVLGTQNLLEFARTQPLESFLFFSSGEVYGVLPPERIPIRENDSGFVDPVQVRSCYAESKRMGETMCVAWAHQYGVPARIVRPFHTYGPGMQLDDGRVFSDFVADLVAGRDLQMKSDGAAIRPYCYLSDATRGFLAVLLKGEVGQAYNVGNDQAEVSVLQLAETLVRLFPEKALRVNRVTAAQAPGYLASPIPRNCPDTTKLRALGWAPRYSIEDGFRRTVQSFL